MTTAARIGYSTNVHPGRTLDEAMAEIERHAPRVRDRLVEHGALGEGEPLALAAWFSSEAARSLRSSDGAVERLADRLRRAKLVVRSLNGFPCGHFHADRVKHAVYRPSWASAERLLHTEMLAEILAELLRIESRGAGGSPEASPRQLAGSISTVPVGWRSEILAGGTGAALGVAAVHLRQLASALHRLEERTGVCIRVDLEPEPGCFVDTSRGLVDLFERHLAPRRGEPDPRRHLGACHDICHAAVMWESQREVIERLRSAGISIGRVQLSSALEWRVDRDAPLVEPFAEPRYLHQTTWIDDGAAPPLRFFEDLPDALRAIRASPPRHGLVARTHLHVPLSAPSAGGLATTRAAIGDFLAAWPPGEPLPAMEVETYTWEVLPPSLRPASLADGIAAEIEWAQDEVRRVRGEASPIAPGRHP